MFRQPQLDAGPAALGAPLQDSGERAAGIENEQVAGAEVVCKPVEARMLDPARPPVGHHQADVVAGDSTAFGRLSGGQLWREGKGERGTHGSASAAGLRAV